MPTSLHLAATSWAANMAAYGYNISMCSGDMSLAEGICIEDWTYRRLVTVSLDLHAAGNTRDGLLASQVGDVDKSVVEPFCQYWSVLVR